MNSAICTLFEGDYHYGVGALANSLYANGFRGTIYAGYRGPLPPWAVDTKEFADFSEFSPVDELTLRFIPLATQVHFTNYKPDFMLDVWENHTTKASSLFYFDPDITIKCRWTFFEEWAEAGVALCADVNPSMPANHPIRHLWKQFFDAEETILWSEVNVYFNAGFVGVSDQNRRFLGLWKEVIGKIGESVGGLSKMIVADRSELFYCPDQDALNIVAMICEAPISTMGQDGMDFQYGGGGYVMSHAIGGNKPWNKRFVRTVLLRAASPSRADKEFYCHVEHPIALYSPLSLWFRRLWVLIASFLGRFIRAG